MLLRQRSALRAAALVLVFAGLLAVGLVSFAQAQPQAQQVQEGKSIFQAKCAACHTIGGGPLVGPDLEGVTTRRPRDWLLRWIAAPDRMLAEGDPTATQLLHEWNGVPMPNQGLTQTEVEAVVAYLESATAVTATPPAGPTGSVTVAPTSQASPQATAQPTVPLAGSRTRGWRLFTGRTHLQNGGPPCIACHHTTGLQSFGGGNLGPDLTQAFQRYGGTSGLTAVLVNIVFPTMVPIFAGHDLTTQDQADLVAFLEAEAQRQPRPPVVPTGPVAAGGALLLFALTPIIWRRRLRGVRRDLVTRANQGRHPRRNRQVSRAGREEGEDS